MNELIAMLSDGGVALTSIASWPALYLRYKVQWSNIQRWRTTRPELYAGQVEAILQSMRDSYRYETGEDYPSPE